ncbi:MAG TPA: hypothetical protein DCW76_02005, partial [Lysinibacillus sp.]|nr:hypothetical protein [Lysinibacillus sp.]
MQQTTISNSNLFRKALEFEKICAEMFEDKGIKVDMYIKLPTGDEVDFVLTNKKGTKIAVEIKFYITRKPNKIMLEKAISKIKIKSQILNIENQVLIIGAPLDTRIKIDLTEKHKVHILDGNNILYLIENNALLLSKFNNLINDIPTEVQDDLKAEAFDLNILFNDKANTIYFEGETKINQGDMMWNELKAISPGRASFDQYEEVCEKILKYLFD